MVNAGFDGTRGPVGLIPTSSCILTEIRNGCCVRAAAGGRQVLGGRQTEDGGGAAGGHTVERPAERQAAL